jgi:hypothetical protein
VELKSSSRSSRFSDNRHIRTRAKAHLKPFLVFAALTGLMAVPTHCADNLRAASPLAERQTQEHDARRIPSEEIEKGPRDAASWFHKGRDEVLAMIGRGLPDDYCDTDNNWIFLALAYLDEAMRLDAPAASQLIFNDRTEFAKFRETPEFRLWWKATTPLPTTEAGLRAFYRENTTWNREGTRIPIRESLTLLEGGKAIVAAGGKQIDGGTWHVDGSKLIISRGSGILSYVLIRSQFFLREGSLHFNVLHLGNDWTMGQTLQDCSNTL